MARNTTSLGAAARSVTGKQPVQPVPVSPVSPVAVSPAPQYGSMYTAQGNPTGYAVIPNGRGPYDGQINAYPVIRGQGSNLIVLPPRHDLFSSMQDRFARFYSMYAPLFAGIAAQAQKAGQRMAGRAGGAGRGTGANAKPKTPPVPATMPKEPEFATYGKFPARWYPNMQMGPNLDRDSFGLMHPVDPYWDKFREANPPKQGYPAQPAAPNGEQQPQPYTPAPTVQPSAPVAVPNPDAWAFDVSQYSGGKDLEGAYSGPYASGRVTNNPYMSNSGTSYVDVLGAILNWWNKMGQTPPIQPNKPSGVFR